MKRQIEELARWLHETSALTEGWGPWKKVGEISRGRYRRVAAALLANPPPCLRKAVRDLEGTDK